MFDNKSYTSRDVASVRNDIIEFIKQREPRITDFSESELTMVYIEALAGVSDMLNYYLDNQARETYLMSARQPKNIRGILETINYKLETFGTARGEAELEILVSADGMSFYGNVIIPKNAILTTGSSPIIEYIVTEETILNATDRLKTVPILQGKLKTLNVKAKDLKRAWKYYLPEARIPLEGIQINQSGVIWEQVEDAYLEIYGGMKYSVHMDSKERAYIIFTFDWTNHLPIDNDEYVTITYLETMGTGGVIPEYALSSIVTDVFDQNNNQVNDQISVRNSSKTYGAYDKINYSLAKANARNFVKTMDRCVVLGDYDTYIRKEPYVVDSNTMDWMSDPDVITVPHYVRSYVVTQEGANISQTQLDELAAKIYSRGIAATTVEIVSPEYIDIPISAKIAVRGSSEYRENIRRFIEQRITEEFAIEKLNFADIINEQRVRDIISLASREITYMDVDIGQPEYLLTKLQFPNITGILVELVGDQYGQT